MAYSKEEIDNIFNSICERIESGESVKSILRDKDMPSSRTFNKWLNEDEEKVNQYVRAKELMAESYFDDIIEIADDSRNDYMIKKIGGEDVEVVNQENIQRSRLRIDARKWALSKMNPKKYGEKLDVTTDSKPINNVMQIEIVNPTDDE
jgi:hypothetical protein